VGSARIDGLNTRDAAGEDGGQSARARRRGAQAP
jgi:hypothetical protein